MTLFNPPADPINSTQTDIAETREEALEKAVEFINVQLSQNQFLPPGWHYDATADPPVPKWYKLDKQNILEILNSNLVSNTDLFVDESPRKTWSNGK